MQKYFVIAFFSINLFSIVISESDLQTQIIQSSSFTQDYRTMVKLQNKKLIDDHNGKDMISFQLKLHTKFAQLTQEQIKEKYTMTNFAQQKIQIESKLLRNPTQIKASQSQIGSKFSQANFVNWTAEGKVSSVKDQGACGSCYAFSAISDIQTTFLFKNQEVSLSQQQIVDCSGNFGNIGCKGGLMHFAFAYTLVNGLVSRSKYPQQQEVQQRIITHQQGRCKFQKGPFRINGYRFTSIYQNDCQALTYMVKQRPVTVAVATGIFFYFYSSGILDLCSWGVNHALVITGFYRDNSINYWMAKNSWGTNWGENGYIKIDRNAYGGNLCEICLFPSYSY